MRNFRMMMSVAMLMVSMSLMAQNVRVTTVLEGTGLVGMYGFSCTLTITPDGNGIIQGKSTREIDPVTIKFKADPSVLYSAIQGNNFMWSYIKEATVSPFAMEMKEKVKGQRPKIEKKPVVPTGSGTIKGQTETNGDLVKFYVRFPIKTVNRQSVFGINFTFRKQNMVEKYRKE